MRTARLARCRVEGGVHSWMGFCGVHPELNVPTKQIEGRFARYTTRTCRCPAIRIPGRNYNSLEVKKHNFSPSSEKYGGCRVFVQNTSSKEKSVINMPSCINYIIGSWCTQRAILWATMHGRPYIPGTSFDESLHSDDVVRLRAGVLATWWAGLQAVLSLL